MTLTTRAPAALLGPDGATVAEGVAVIWADADGWGGIFEPAAGAAPVAVAAATLRTRDGRQAPVTLAPSEFLADGARPLTFRGAGPLERSPR
jgi:hypothetical protein